MKHILFSLVLCAAATFAQAQKTDVQDLLRKAEAGDPKSQSGSGYAYFSGEKLPKNPDKAIFWTMKAVEAGYAPAMVNLGYFYSVGFGVPADQSTALRWYLEAGEKGEPLGLYNAGLMHVRGLVDGSDMTAAPELFRKAAAKGNSGAKLALAGMLLNGQGVEKDPKKAVKLYEDAARAGESRAQLDLGKIYSNGIGIDKDLREARYWYGMAFELSKDTKAKAEAKAGLDALAAIQRQTVVAEDKKNRGYVETLRQKYGKRLTYQTDYARSTIKGFNLDCKTGDGRYLPLENVLLAKLASMDSDKVRLTIRANSQGQEVRIYDEIVGADGLVMDSALAFELNGKWGEIRSRGFRMEAVLNSCYGNNGPIWLAK